MIDGQYVVTALHVVADNMDDIAFLLAGVEYEATYVAGDYGRDLALVELNTDPGVAGLPVAGVEGLQPGTPVLKLGYGISEIDLVVTSGIVSALHNPTRVDPAFIRTDLAINSGDSGAPIINAVGHVVGVVVAKFVGAAIEGAGLAVQWDMSGDWLDTLKGGDPVCQPTPPLLLEKNTRRYVNFPLGFNIEQLPNRFEFYADSEIGLAYFWDDNGRAWLAIFGPYLKSDVGGIKNWMLELGEDTPLLLGGAWPDDTYSFMSGPRRVCHPTGLVAFEADLIVNSIALTHRRYQRWMGFELGGVIYLVHADAHQDDWTGWEEDFDTMLYTLDFA